MSVYLDYNASAPVDARVLDYMMEIYREHVGNPDSRTHNFGETARQTVEQARRQVAALLGVEAQEVIFTSGATESCNIAIQGLESYGRSTGRLHIVTTAVEHKAVLATAQAMQRRGFDVDYILPEMSGRISAEALLSRVREDTLLVSIMHVNNETGTIQPVQEIGKALSEMGVLFHTDATQSCGKLVDEVRALTYDMLSFSAHKFGGPQGVGALILRRRHYKYPPVQPLMYGGGQEHGLRPGTVPVALVAGCGKACELAGSQYKLNQQKCLEIREKLLALLRQSGIEYELNGDPEHSIANTLNIRFVGVSAEALMIASRESCAVSNGSACTASDYTPSHVLTAMGRTEQAANEAIRISWGADEDQQTVISAFAGLLETVRRFKS